MNSEAPESRGQETPEDRGLVAHVGRIDVDIPRSVGYFGAIGMAVAFEVIEWPVGLFIAAIPFVKMLNRPRLPQPVRFAEHVLDGAAKPVGGGSEGTIRIANQESSAKPPGQPPAPATRAQPSSRATARRRKPNTRTSRRPASSQSRR